MLDRQIAQVGWSITTQIGLLLLLVHGLASNPGPHRHRIYDHWEEGLVKPPFCLASLPTIVGKISTQNSEPWVPFSSLFLAAKNVEVSPGAGWACQGTNTRQSPAWGSSTPQHAQKRGLCFGMCRFSQVMFITSSNLTHNLFFYFQ